MPAAVAGAPARGFKAWRAGADCLLMHPRRVLRAGTPAEVSVLALMNLVRGAGCLLLVGFPLSAEAPIRLMVALGIADLAVAAVLLAAGGRVRPAVLHAAVIQQILQIAVMVGAAGTERGMMLAAIGYVWSGAYVAVFFRSALARAYAALMTAGLAIGLLTTSAPADVSLAILLMAMVWAAVLTLNGLSARLVAQAHTDDLTGLLNRTGFALAAARLRAAAGRNGNALALAVIDLDDFKIVNDRHGHAAGDRLLVGLASAWTSALRPADVLARYGGDEFVLLFPDASAADARAVLKRLEGAYPIGWTSGVVACERHESLDEAIVRADEELYRAKALRRQALAEESAAAPLETADSAPQGATAMGVRVVDSRATVAGSA